MREILFRGKQINNGEWFIGDLYRQTDYFGNKQTIIFENKGAACCKRSFVDPETVCQYTGLTDKNGNKIFEGDIVNVPYFTKPNMLVAFIEGAFCFANKEGEYVADIHYIHHAGIECAEVIGNIFNNPELLEVQNG